MVGIMRQRDANAMRFSFAARFGSITAVVLLIPLIAGCNPEPPQRERTALVPRDYDPTEGIPEHYHFLYAGGLGYDEIDDVWDSLPITRIELERTECFGTCPSYVTSFSAGGPASYNGRKYSPRVGSFDGEIEIWDYGNLCWMIDRFKLLDGPREYSANWTDSATAIIRITMRDSNDTIEISDYGGQGPIELWSLFNAADAAANRIEWKPSAE